MSPPLARKFRIGSGARETPSCYHLQAPFIIGGDWQNAPADLAATTIPSKFKAQIIATSGPTTLQGSHLDFILASTAIAGSLRLEANWEAPGNLIVPSPFRWTVHMLLSLCCSFSGFLPSPGTTALSIFGPVTRRMTAPS